MEINVLFYDKNGSLYIFLELEVQIWILLFMMTKELESL